VISANGRDEEINDTLTNRELLSICRTIPRASRFTEPATISPVSKAAVPDQTFLHHDVGAGSKPISMTRRRAISLTNIAVIADLLLWVFGGPQARERGTHSAWIYRSIRPEDPE